MDRPKYKRVLLKISGEALAGEASRGLDFDMIGRVCDVIQQCCAIGVQIGVVVGGGNFWRGLKDGGDKMVRVRADHMGMLATTINCLAAPRPSGIWRRGESSSSAAAPATRFSPPTPLRCCGRRRSTRT